MALLLTTRSAVGAVAKATARQGRKVMQDDCNHCDAACCARIPAILAILAVKALTCLDG